MKMGTEMGQQRKIRHQEIRELMLTNKMDQALNGFHETIKTFGPHIGLLCDLAGFYYESDRFEECNDTVDLVCQEYQKAEAILSMASKHKTALMLAKFYEERAEIAEALKWLAKATQFCETQNDRKWVFVNELRLLSYFGLVNDLQKKYLVVLELVKTETSLVIETLHGLLWAEWALFGYHHAINRWNELQGCDLHRLDQRLIARDFIEISILSQPKADELSVLQAQGLLKGIDKTCYDQVLLFRLENIKTPSSLMDLDGSKLSLMMRLRLLILFCKQETDSLKKIEHLKKFSFLIGYLTPASQELFRRIQPTMDETKFILSLHAPAKKLKCQSPALDMKVTSLQLKLLKSFSEKNNLSLDQVAENLWGGDSSESIYHRLRMLIYKLNEQLYGQLGLKPFEITKNSISLNPNVQIEIRQ